MILIDKAVGSRELISYSPLSDLSCLSHLDSADIAFNGNGPNDSTLSIGIELKSLSDFRDSILSGRLHGRQTRLMLQTYDVSYLLIYGIYKCDLSTGNALVPHGHTWVPLTRGYVSSKDPRDDGRRTPVPYSFIESCIFSAEAIGLRVRVLPYSHHGRHVHDTRQHLAYYIYCLFSWWAKDWHDHKSIRQFDDSQHITKSTANLETMGLSDAQLLTANIAKDLPGIRYERAMAIAREFNTPREFLEMLTKRPDDLADIVTVSGKGRRVKIGKVISERVRLALDGKLYNKQK